MTLLSSFINSNNVLVDFVLSMYTTISFASGGCFTSSFAISILPTPFSCLIALARTSRIRLSRSHNVGPRCLIPNLSGGVEAHYSVLTTMLAVAILYQNKEVSFC